MQCEEMFSLNEFYFSLTFQWKAAADV